MRDRSPLFLDPGVLNREPLLEIFGWAAIEACGGQAVLPHRRAWSEALAARVDAVSSLERIDDDCVRQALVHLQKGRAATQAGLCAAWNHLKPGGRLLLSGANELGIKSAVKRLAGELGQRPEILANRARSRVAVFERSAAAGPKPPAAARVTVEAQGDAFTIESAVGVFSADGVDKGTQLVLDYLSLADEPERVFDMGCGLGILGLSALRRWPHATAVFADVDRRAVSITEKNAVLLGLANRCTVAWWDATTEVPPIKHCDLALVNPPFHSGKAVDLDPPRAMFAALDQVLEPRGKALVVANRTLPYERDLSRIGSMRQVVECNGFKLLELRR